MVAGDKDFRVFREVRILHGRVNGLTGDFDAAAAVIVKELDIGIDHELYEFVELCLWFPAELSFGF